MKRIACVIWFFLGFQVGFGQNLHLKGLSSNFIQSGQFSFRWSYNLHVLSVYNAKSLTISHKVFPNGHSHFIPQVLINRRLSSKIQSGLGFAFTRHNIFGVTENEPRFFLQTVYSQSLSKLKFSHRARVELRYPKNITSGVRDRAIVGRYALGLNYPLKKNASRGIYLSASNEAFLYLEGANNGPVSSRNGSLLSENWTSVGLGCQFRKSKLEVGYGYQLLIRNKKQEYRQFELLQLTYQRAVNWDSFEMWWYQ